MATDSEIIVDFLYEMWAYQYPKVVIAMLVFWLIYLYLRNPCLVDVAYVCNHFIVGTSLYYNISNQVYFKPIVLYIALTMWFLRLAGFLFLTRIAKSYKDPRYEKISEEASSKAAFFFINYQFQGIIVIFTSSPLYFVFRQPSYINLPTFVIGMTMIVIGIIFEGISDQQLYNWKQSGKGRGQIFAEGLWRKSRHPNLFFELVTWCGFALTAVNNDLIDLVAFAGPVILWGIMNFLTIPITERYMEETRAEWPNFVKRTNKLLPF